MYTYLIESFGELFHIIGYIINAAGIFVVLWGFIVSLKEFIRMKMKGHSFSSFFLESNRIRAMLGTYILFGLEFMIAADILHTFLKPNMMELLTLGIVVLIRTVISYFLAKEVDEAKHDKYEPNEREKVTRKRVKA